MIVATYIYQDFADGDSSTYKFRESVARHGLELHNVAPPGGQHVGNGEVLRLLGNLYKSLPADEPVVYADGADSFFLRVPNVPTDSILYSTEKAIWPPKDELREKWDKHYDGPALMSEWLYLNGGGYCGPAGLLAEFFQRYLMELPADANGQWQQAEAFFQACVDAMPIFLDTRCEEFQTIGFAGVGDFSTRPGVLINNITNTRPAVIHGNGRTKMDWIYNLDV